MYFSSFNFPIQLPNDASRETVTGFYIILLTEITSSFFNHKRERKNSIVNRLKVTALEIKMRRKLHLIQVVLQDMYTNKRELGL